MKPRGVFPALEQAVDFLHQEIRKGALKQGERLPSIRYCADKAGVSEGSMFKAFQRLKSDGTITGEKRHRMIVGSRNTISNAESKPVPQWQKKRMRLEKDIISGVLGTAGRLPPLKELQSRYGACFNTMKKVMAALEIDGIIVSQGKGYAATSPAARTLFNRIVFITLSGHFTQESALNHEHNRIVNLFENECIRMGLFLEMIELDFYDTMACRSAASKITGGDTTLGFILDVWWYDPESFRTAYLDVLERITSLKKPVAVLDELGSFILPSRFAGQPLVQTYSIERNRAGERVARFMLRKGHRSVVYISSMHNTEWSQERYRGIVDQFSRAGFEKGVHLVAGDVGGGILNLLAASGLQERDVRKLISLGRTPAQAQDLERQWRSFVDDPPSRAEAFRKKAAPALRQDLALLQTILATGVDDDFLKRACDGALFAASARTSGIDLEPLFQSALANRDSTGWICANDMIAFEALTFLHKQGVRVPAEISVAGFDNVPVQSLERRLTTLDFNASGFVQQMLSFISRPQRSRGQNHDPVIEVEGILMERGTTGKAPPVHHR
jgi:DNA-binding transcriptional regulator YhcF (GntR family)